ncbi:membrane-associated oxidoreductase [Streptomyces sp. NPDC087294]|uniref:membrane-associated oxidoreductase n=1 Tax=Streptomyces sp. NPDC087294 TaxID=3365777 RepID=UPI003800FECC
MENDDLTPAETSVWRAFACGHPVDFRTGPDEDATGEDTWGPERTLRASVLKTLLVSAPRQEGEIAALKVRGARITGTLRLTHGVLDHPVSLTHCRFDETPELYAVRLRQLNLRGSVLPGLNLGGSRIDGVLRLTDCHLNGPLRLGGAQIAAALFMERARLVASDGTQAALQLTQAVIGDDLWAPELSVRGETRLNGTSVSGTLNIEGARFDHPGATALSALTLDASADVNARQVRTRGQVDLRGARIAGRLDLSHSWLRHPGGVALRASSCVIGELWLSGAEPVRGTLHLRRSRIDVLSFAPEVVPGEVLLNELTFTALTPHEPAERRLPLLERDGEGYVPYAYEQLTAAYRRIGDDRGARAVQLAGQRRLRATLPWYGRLWGHLQDITVGYGFRPLRAAAWLVSLLAAGSLVYALHPPRPLKASESPHFDAVFYTLDLLLPVISFGQEGAFAPDGWYQALSYALIITGWVLATTVVTGVTRSVSRQ